MDVCLLMLLFVDTCLINMVGKVRIQWGWMGRLVATFQVCKFWGSSTSYNQHDYISVQELNRTYESMRQFATEKTFQS